MSDVASRLLFLKSLHVVTNRIHATNNIDDIVLQISSETATLFKADRFTLYSVEDEGKTLVSMVKTGLHAYRELRLPVSNQSVAGFVAQHKCLLNLHDVYDDAELAAISPDLHFMKEVDRKTGYRCKQMLVVPILNTEDRLIGVMQLINHLGDEPFPQIAEEGGAALAQTMAIALAQRQKPTGMLRSRYQYLVEDGLISVQEMEAAQREAREKGLDLEQVLEERTKVPLGKIGVALAKFFGVSYEPYRPDRIKPTDLLRNIKREYVHAMQWLPLEENAKGLIVVATDPERVRSSHIVKQIFPNPKIVYRVTTNREFALTVDHFFGDLSNMGSVDDLLTGLGDSDENHEASDRSAAADNELVRLVNKVIVEACQQGASDIHIEPRPGKEKTLICLRRDGSLVNYIEVPASFRSALVTRIKIMADLDIAEKRKPQDGKIKFRKYGPMDIELRVATMPTAGGVEDVVMRILRSGEPMPIEQLGLSAVNRENLLKCVDKPYGLFFVCGPTGSGKTTTLHSILSYLNRPDTKIWTAEDPVEITQKGLRQVQVNRKAGLDFATVMRSLLRVDPDIIMVGEMRDSETASIGIEASLTGHLVLATLHTNSAPESVVRLLDMGMDPFNFSDALLGILAQRLAKQLCPACKEAYPADSAEIDRLLQEYCEELENTPLWHVDRNGEVEKIRLTWQQHYAKDGRITLFKAKGCSACGDTGYKGRIGLHEMLVGTPAVKKLIQDKARVSEILACALNEGMRTLKMDGVERILQGLTDLKQVRAVCIK